MQTKNQELGSNISLDNTTTGTFSNRIDVSQFDRFTIQANFTYGVGDDAAGDCTLEASLDATNWSLVPDSTIAYASTTGNNQWSITVNVYKWVRIKFLATSSTDAGAVADVIFQGFINDRT